MDEFIDKLSKDIVFNRKTFAEVIQKAMLVQRKVCVRAISNGNFDLGNLGNENEIYNAIESAEITEEDYE